MSRNDRQDNREQYIECIRRGEELEQKTGVPAKKWSGQLVKGDAWVARHKQEVRPLYTSRTYALGEIPKK